MFWGGMGIQAFCPSPSPDDCRCPAQERLRRLNHSVAKETVRRKAMLEAAGGYPQGLPGK